jgi:hypothetical protein
MVAGWKAARTLDKRIAPVPAGLPTDAGDALAQAPAGIRNRSGLSDNREDYRECAAYHSGGLRNATNFAVNVIHYGYDRAALTTHRKMLKSLRIMRCWR